MLIDRFLPDYDVSEVCDIRVNASWQQTYAAIRTTDFSDPIVKALFALRALPLRFSRRWRRHHSARPELKVNFGTLVEGDGPLPILGEVTGIELVVGSVGQFWRKEYSGRALDGEAFRRFNEPGYAKLAVSFAVIPAGKGRSVITYEARTATTDATARRSFGRYWLLARPAIALVMRRLLRRIKAEAERPASAAA